MKIYLEGTKRAAVSRMFPIWESRGHKIVTSPQQANIQFSSVRIVNKSGLPTILRIDGICYDRGVDFKAKNKAISKSHQIANAIIYQSRTSRKMCEEYLNPRQTDIARVIHNGLDPKGWNKPIKHDGINIMCCAKWRRPKRLKETIQVFDLFRQRYPSSQLHILGVFVKGSLPIPHPNVIYYGKLDYAQIRKIYRIGDLFIHLCKKDSCPSAVVEAMAAGLPVVTTNACGGAAEMARLAKGCIVVPNESESIQPDFIYQDACHQLPNQVKSDLVDAMMVIANTRPRIKFPETLTIDYIANKYLEVMGAII